MRYTNPLVICLLTLLLVLSAFGLASIVEEDGLSSAEGYTLSRYDERRSGQAPIVGDLTDPVVRWTYDRPLGVLTSPIVADINDDGRYEVVFGGTDGKVTALDEDGNFIWEVQEKAITSVGTVGDVDGDDKQEVIVSELYHTPQGGLSIIVLNGEDGSEVWRYTPIGFAEEGFAGSPILYDITGDGVYDLLVGSMTYKYYAFDGPTGNVIWSEHFEHFIRVPSPMADIDNDGRMELVGIDNHGLAKIMDAKTGAVEWEDYVGYCSGSTPAVGDLDGDGLYEIVLPMCVTGGTVVLNHDGSIHWQVDNNTRFYSSPTLVDVDGDGLEDVINTDVLTWTVLAYKGTTGDLIWHKTLPNTTWAQGSLVSVDIDGDNDIEIIAGSDTGLYSLNSQTGEVEWFFETGRVRGEPFVIDLEQEGGSEIVYTSNSTVYVIEQKNEPPIPVIDIYREVMICMRIEGRKWNMVEATFYEDTTPVEKVILVRVPGSPNRDMICVTLKIRPDKSYSIVFKYANLGVGANPIDIILDDTKGKRIKVIFNPQQGESEITINLDSDLAKLFKDNWEYIFDASKSYDPDGYIVSYFWNFDDGNFKWGKIVKHTFLVRGEYTILLEVKDNKDAFASTSTTLTVS